MVFPALIALNQSAQDPLPLLTHITTDGYEIRTADHPFANLIFKNTPKPVLYPVHGPSGAPVTRNFPIKPGVPGEATDHPHHRSLWFAHGDINGHDFWLEGEDKGIVKTLESTLQSTKNAVVVSLKEQLQHKLKPVANQTTTITFTAYPDRRTIDYDITLNPLLKEHTLTFGDTKEGTVAIRTRPELQLTGVGAKGQAVNSEGVSGKDVWGKRAKWVAYWAHVEGKTVGLAIFDHPQNHAHPTWWHARDYGLVAANPFGRHDFEGGQPGSGKLELKPGQSLRLRYRFLFFLGNPTSANVSQEFDQWSKT